MKKSKIKVDDKLKKLIVAEVKSWNGEYRRSQKGKDIAKIIIKHYNIKHPINMKELLEKLKIKLYDAKFKKENPGDVIWGALNTEEGSIYISKHLKTSRVKRFTIAHALGRVFIDYIGNKKRDAHILYRNKLDSKEVIINDFAANLLVPVSDREFLDRFKTKSIYEIAYEFDVPYETIGTLGDRLLKEEERRGWL